MSGLLRKVGNALASPAARLKRAEAMIAAADRDAAFPLLTPLAQAGNERAEFLVGRAYLEGGGVPKSAREGAYWLERSAEHGNKEAPALIAALYLQGVIGPTASRTADAGDIASRRPAAALFSAQEPGKPDFENAVIWARKAAATGAPDGQALLGYILTAGPEALRDLDEADRLYKLSAEAECPQGYLGYGLALLRKDDPSLHDEAIKWMRLAAATGLATGFYLLGAMTEQGQGTPADLAAAGELYREAAMRGLRAAQARYGLFLLDGRGGTKKDPQEGESWLRRAALQGDIDAAALVGDLYSRGGDLPPNFAEAGMWYRRAAEGGHRAAARALGLMNLNGNGIPKDHEEAARWFRISAEGGDTTSRYDLAALALQREAAPEEAQRTREWFEKEANGGDLVGAYNYGICLAEGVGVARDDAQALIWLRRAAASVVNAQYWYGRMLVEGRGAAADPVEGRIWIGKAAEAGMLDALVAFAELLVNGSGGDKDHPKALTYFERAAKGGHVGAMFAMGAMLGGGHDVPWDRVAAQGWFRMAAERGHAYAMTMLGRYLARGLAGDTNLDEARFWFTQAVQLGLAEAQGDLAALAAPAEPVAAGQPAA
ncbi:MAG: tetratricopeptide repeat protein [Alphaproteobacteria bacterium]|nr:tetratricopeptide repeat protein [Alphaproteobacteria bacterium]